ncbi:hypothetical protein LCGC14_0578240 [marine sediment metagenome]|uniref:Uncharacterized protein n=1 Tax=marine sediment metagenome TaxID=412755 RepID=A0A0F9UQH0_9ZZZZ
MNSFWRFVVQEAVDTNLTWKRLIKAFPELDDEVVKSYYEQVGANNAKLNNEVYGFSQETTMKSQGRLQ